MMRRREFITWLGGAVTWPLAARAQQPAMPVVGYLHPGSPGAAQSRTAAFLQGLSDQGYIDGRNVAIEFRWAEDRLGSLPILAADLVRLKVAVLATVGTEASLVGTRATKTIPHVF
jgi:putative tryptophan/tyrosine transport system substrate-binding protein